MFVCKIVVVKICFSTFTFFRFPHLINTLSVIPTSFPLTSTVTVFRLDKKNIKVLNCLLQYLLQNFHFFLDPLSLQTRNTRKINKGHICTCEGSGSPGKQDVSPSPWKPSGHLKISHFHFSMIASKGSVHLVKP